MTNPKADHWPEDYDRVGGECELSKQQWQQYLPELSYRVLRHAATEPAFTGEYYDMKDKGMYRCRGCGQPLFLSDDKYDSGTGWPSFTKPVDTQSVEAKKDFKLVVPRTEIRCSRCKGHLGHVFSDGPGPDGQRYCMNSAALQFDSTQGADSAEETAESPEV